MDFTILRLIVDFYSCSTNRDKKFSVHNSEINYNKFIYFKSNNNYNNMNDSNITKVKSTRH